MRKFLVLLMALTLTAAPLFAMPKQVMTTTHRIEMTFNTVDLLGDTKKARTICSATAIGPHALLTATHCDAGASMVTVDSKEVSIVDRMADGHDHTIYMVDTTFSNFSNFGNMVKAGDEVWLRGNPDGLPQLVRKGIYSGSFETTEDGTHYFVYVFDINGWHGDSGSAIFDKHGKIIAVTSIGLTDGGWTMLGTFPLNFTQAQLAKAGRKSVYCLTA